MFDAYGVYLRLLIVSSHGAHGPFAKAPGIARIAYGAVGEALGVGGRRRRRCWLRDGVLVLRVTCIKAHSVAMSGVGDVRGAAIGLTTVRLRLRR